MPTIIVALDGSPASEKALDAAVRLAQQDNRHVMAISVLPRAGDPQLAELSQSIAAQARHHLEENLQAAVNFA
jgi:nucleotide-binding universal stress UspA family protein